MARFSDLPFELQTDIWTLVLPHRGGIHWVEFEGLPHASHIINKSLEWTDHLFGKEPKSWDDSRAGIRNFEYRKYSRDHLGPSSSFFQYLYATVPSVYGKSKGLREDMLAQDMLDEIAATQRCRQLSTYTQVTTLLSICQTSRLAALDYLRKMIPIAAWPLHRSGGPMYRPRPLNTWKQQYQTIETVPEGPEKLIPTICGTLDLVVYRLHTASGYPMEILNHAYYQMVPYYDYESHLVPSFDRIGIEWHPLWATPEGRKELCEYDVGNIVLALGTNRSASATQLYWLIDGIPRPQWDQYPPAIPIAFSRVIEKRKDWILHHWNTDKAWKDRLLKHHDLYQEFEANGRRYYVVFVLTKWTDDYIIEESLRDPAVSWDGPFPGGEDLWPEALRDLVRVAYKIQRLRVDNMWTDPYCSYVLSWEPI